ncbi:MAG TPA: nucleotidyltransferase domain-containing protein [Atribacterota bacterium]|nr:nucleotidyltransferase domain-containing protein [Atribacterota bacterium]
MNARTEELAEYYKQKYPFTFTKAVTKDEPFLTKRYKEAWEIAKKAAVILKSNYGATKVVVFGSLTDRPSFTLWSDIDLAVWGIPENKFYAAVGAVTALTADFKIDLVDAIDCRDSLKKALEIEGVEI